ncbi:MAG: GNAT family N-acetyltransferase [Bacteroidota bacterium]
MEVNIRQGNAEDMQAVHQLVMELALFEKAPNEVITSPEILTQDAFGERDNFSTIVAETELKEVVGICLYYIAYSSWKGRILFLDDIVIREAYRGKGIGRKMMLALFEIAKEKGVKQMRWQVLDWNENAIVFYESLGAIIDKEWFTCKMNF